MNYYGISDIGLVRKSNQDCYSITENEHGNLLAVVCDGVGGGQSGDVASKSAAHFFNNEFLKSPVFNDVTEVKTWINEALSRTNDFVLTLAATKTKYHGMGTTLVAALQCPIGTFIANIGDSRAYRFQDGQLFGLTKDHTLVEALVAQGVITEAETFNHPQRHVLTNAIGIEQTLLVDLFTVTEPYQLLLLCSDGLHGYLADNEINELIPNRGKLQLIARHLIDRANAKGGFDNTTVVLIGAADFYE
ncbi:Serine/threonine phosphatase stp [bioreactor metagenome]|uniref:Serine/threonine phosphatase stp n=1 Tax=bioreactor metagenome TaxID=1076179 RepID=A0A645CM82_9ZZZZ|nr:Stp1/IreP family PP2C-type Ser/Thr phosphatase [Erysipelotrichaceae bacterium]